MPQKFSAKKVLKISMWMQAAIFKPAEKIVRARSGALASAIRSTWMRSSKCYRSLIAAWQLPEPMSADSISTIQNNEDDPITDILSLTVIGPDVYEADRFATAAFAMGRSGIDFIEDFPGFEGYMIDKDKQATYTTGFTRFVLSDSIR